MALKVVKHTADELVIRRTPYGVWLLGVISIALGIVVAALLMGISAFECDRSTDRCLLEKSWLLREGQVTDHALADLKGARVVTSRSSDRGHSYHVEFLFRDERLRLTNHSSSDRHARRQAVREIEKFLGNPAQEMVRIEQSGRFTGGLFALIFSGIGVYLILVGTFGKFRFSIPEDNFTVTSWGLLGKQREKFRLWDVKGLRSESMQTQSYTNRGVIDLKNGKSIYMTPYSIHITSHFSNTKPSALRVVETLGDFLLKRPES